MNIINEKKTKIFFVSICLIMMLGTNASISMAQESEMNNNTQEAVVSLVDPSPESDFTYNVVNDTYCSITGYTGSDEVVVIPSTLGGYTVEAIVSKAFENCTFTEIDIPDSVKYIGPEAFLNCQNLEKVGYPAGWTQCYWFQNDEFYDGYVWNKSPFIGCSSLKEITVDEGVTTIPKYAFRNCTSLERINLPESLTTIEAFTFDGCTALKTVTVPKDVTAIEHNAFSWCVGLDNITLPENLEKIGSSAFIGCSSLKEVTVPSGVAIINPTVFKDCTALDKITLPNTVEIIESSAFENCTFTEIDIPDSVKYIGPEAFLNCQNLEKVGYPAGWTQCYWNLNNELYDGYVWNKSPFIGCSSLKEITVDEGVTTIPKYAFRYCDGLEIVTLPKSVTKIEGYAFDWCTSLKKVIFGDGITTIGNNVFNGCSSLAEIVLPCDKLGVITDTGIVKNDDGFSVVDTDNINGVFTLTHSYKDGICSCGEKQDLSILDVVDNTVKIYSPTASAENDTAAIILSSYLDDKLVGVKIVNLPLKAGTNDYTVTGFDAGDCDTIRVFVWDNIKNLSPLCKDYDKEVDISK